ncbi:hypothetical protein B0H11DRAFT_689630 [Mycena galericulata]|nr:hypothetical protein B0H11DRAFT_689630 [Mycena galericulata]
MPTNFLVAPRFERCDGESPCAPCTRARTRVVCNYIPRTVGELRSEIPKGGACVSCRQRKRRCDGNLPCQTCKTACRPQECQYLDKSSRRGPKPASSHHDNGDHRTSPDGASTSPSSWSTNNSPAHTPDYSVQLELAPYSTDDTISSFVNFQVSLSEMDDFSTANDSHLGPSAFPHPTGADGALDDRSCADKILRLSDLPHLDSHIPNLGLSPPHDNVDRAAELFAIRNLFLDHCWQFGLNGTAEQLDALSRGDTSGAVVHPILVNICQLFGYLVAQQSHSETWLYLQSHPTELDAAEQAQARAIFHTLHAHGRQTRLDPVTSMQVYALLALYYTMRGDLELAVELVRKLGGIVIHSLDHMLLCLEYTPLAGPPLHLSCYPQGPVQEAQSAFSGMVWVDVARSLVLKCPLLLDPSILTTFRRLAVSFSYLIFSTED